MFSHAGYVAGGILKRCSKYSKPKQGCVMFKVLSSYWSTSKFMNNNICVYLYKLVQLVLAYSFTPKLHNVPEYFNLLLPTSHKIQLHFISLIL